MVLLFLSPVIGYALVAVATGHSQILDWPFTLMEVDVAPPWGPCRIQTFAFSDVGSGYLRHGLYANAEVQQAVADLIDETVQRQPDAK
jgi:hypothetical protein